MFYVWLATTAYGETKFKTQRAVVVERSNASVYLIIDTLELKVEGSNPGVAVCLFFELKSSIINTR